MKLLLLLASLVIITIPNAHSRILQGIMNSGGNKFDMIIGINGRQLRSPPPSPTSSRGFFHSAGGDKFDVMSSVYGRQGPSPPPPPSQSPSKHQSARGINSSPNCDDHDITIRSPPPPTNFAAREESDMIRSSVGGREGPTLPPPAPRRSPGIVTLGMPGRPCTGGRPPMIAMSAEGSLCKEHLKATKKSPPPPPKNSPGIVTLGRSKTPPVCMPGRPCTGGFVKSS